jgi:hypothetical protein
MALKIFTGAKPSPKAMGTKEKKTYLYARYPNILLFKMGHIKIK